MGSSGGISASDQSQMIASSGDLQWISRRLPILSGLAVKKWTAVRLRLLRDFVARTDCKLGVLSNVVTPGMW